MHSKSLTTTILSLSLLTVMAGAVISPALGSIANYYRGIDSLYIKMIATVPSLFIIITNTFFSSIAARISTKKIALLGLALYVLGGCLGGVVNSIWILLLFRSILGIGVGLLMPLSTGLITYYYPQEEQARLMGYSAGMNNLGGMIAISLSGFLVAINWRYSFLVYLLGIAALILVWLFLPDRKITKKSGSFSLNIWRKGSLYYLSMFVTMLVFYVFPTNFALVVSRKGNIDPAYIGILMAVQTLVSFFVGMKFEKIKNFWGSFFSFIPATSFALGFFVLTVEKSMIALTLGIALIGLGLGSGVPLLNVNLSKRTDKEEATSAMALMGIALYLGQFVSPLLISFLESLTRIGGLIFPYYVAILFSGILLFIMKIAKV